MITCSCMRVCCTDPLVDFDLDRWLLIGVGREELRGGARQHRPSRDDRAHVLIRSLDAQCQRGSRHTGSSGRRWGSRHLAAAQNLLGQSQERSAERGSLCARMLLRVCLLFVVRVLSVVSRPSVCLRRAAECSPPGTS
jgi:hypothetical protein